MQNFKNKEAKQVEIPLSHITGSLPRFVGNVIVCSHFNQPLQTLYMALPSGCKKTNKTKCTHTKILSVNNFLKFWTVPLESTFVNTNPYNNQQK